MNNPSKIPLIVSLIAIVIAIIGLFTPAGQRVLTSVGALSTTNYPAIGTTQLQVGSGCDNSYSTCSGSTVSSLLTGTCTILAYATTITASSTAQVDCQAGTSSFSAISGIQTGDKVFVTLASTTAYTNQGGLILEHAAASTTAGSIVLKLFNATGGTFTWASTASTSISYLDLR